MTYTVIEEEVDMAGKWRLRVDLGTESAFFKFQEKPTTQELDEVVAKYLEVKNGAADENTTA